MVVYICRAREELQIRTYLQKFSSKMQSYPHSNLLEWIWNPGAIHQKRNAIPILQSCIRNLDDVCWYVTCYYILPCNWKWIWPHWGVVMPGQCTSVVLFRHRGQSLELRYSALCCIWFIELEIAVSNVFSWSLVSLLTFVRSMSTACGHYFRAVSCFFFLLWSWSLEIKNHTVRDWQRWCSAWLTALPRYLASLNS